MIIAEVYHSFLAPTILGTFLNYETHPISICHFRTLFTFLACVFFKRKETMSYSSLNPSLNIVGIQQTFEEQTG